MRRYLVCVALLLALFAWCCYAGGRDWQELREYVVVDAQAMTNSLPTQQWKALYTAGMVIEDSIDTTRFSIDRKWLVLKFAKNSTAATAWFDAKGVPYTKHSYTNIIDVLKGTNWTEEIP